MKCTVKFCMLMKSIGEISCMVGVWQEIQIIFQKCFSSTWTKKSIWVQICAFIFLPFAALLVFQICLEMSKKQQETKKRGSRQVCLINNSALKKTLLMISSSHWDPGLSNLISSRDGISRRSQPTPASEMKQQQKETYCIQTHVCRFLCTRGKWFAFDFFLNNNIKKPLSPQVH